MRFLNGFLFLLAFTASIVAEAQEYALPLQENAVVKARSKVKSNTAHRPTVLGLPFFEDFTGYDPYPDPEKWGDRYVYINNTMGWNMISRGVATFDALNDKGNVYDSTIAAYTQIYADSLTSLPIDLSTNTPADSLYISFFYQPQGYGFAPKPYDSLMLFLLKSNSGIWEKVWTESGDTLQPFRQVMIPVTDTAYFNAGFQMRWVNKATKGISDSHWNLDYIRFDAGRAWNDTIIRDIAFTKDPASILNDFTAMPFRHFKTNPSSFLNTSLTAINTLLQEQWFPLSLIQSSRTKSVCKSRIKAARNFLKSQRKVDTNIPLSHEICVSRLRAELRYSRLGDAVTFKKIKKS